MRRFVALVAIAWILACAGNALPCAAAGACVVADDSCCDPAPTDHAGCPPGPDCPCCPGLRPAPIVLEVAPLVPSEDEVQMTESPDAFQPTAPPREILHVPKLGPVAIR